MTDTAVSAEREVADELVDPAPKSTQVTLFDPLRAIEKTLNALQVEFVKSYDWDIETAADEKKARAFRAWCVEIRSKADKAYEIGNAPLLKEQRDARELVKDIKSRVETMESDWDEKIKAKEKRKAEEKRLREEALAKRAAEIRLRMEAISSILVSVAAGSSLEVQAAHNQLFSAPLNEELFGDFVTEATALTYRVLEQLSTMHKAALLREREAAELQRQRDELVAQQRKADEERAEQVRKDAAEKARVAQIEDGLLQIREGGTEVALRCKTADESDAEIRVLEKFVVTRAQFQERFDEAISLKDATLKQMRELSASRRAAEQEAARQAEHAAVNNRMGAELRKQLDAFEAEKAAAAQKLEDELAASAERIEADLQAVEQSPEAPLQMAEVQELPQPDLFPAYRPDEEEILSLLARSFDVSQHEALEWITHFDVDSQVQRLKEVA